MPEPRTLLTMNGSAYAATLAADEEESYLLTAESAYRLEPGREPERWRLELGLTPVLMHDHVLYWSDGAFRWAHKRGSDPAVLAAVPHVPQRVVASGGRFAWLDHAEDGRFTIRTIEGSKPRILYAASGDVATLTMDEERVYFVEHGPGSGWRLGAVSLSGDSARHTRGKTGRTPAMLAASRELFYYDGPSSTVRRVSPDLQREAVVVGDVICSPIAVAEHVFCAEPGGLRAIGRDGVVRWTLPLSRNGTVTAVAATESRLTWLMDVGQGRLVVETARLGSALGRAP